MRVTIQNIGGRWLFDGMPYSELSEDKKQYVNRFLKETKLTETVKKTVHDPNFQKPISDLDKIYSI